MKINILSSSLRIEQSQQKVTAVLAIATIISVFSLVSAKQLWSQAHFQRHVTSARHQSALALVSDVAAANQLSTHYNSVFETSTNPSNIIGGKNTTSKNAKPPDGDNARVVLDALPSSYDFPALISSLTTILKNDNISSPTITGTDQSATANNTPSANPQPVVIQLSMSGTGSVKQVKKLMDDLDRSIRPFDVTQVQLRGSNASMNFTLSLKTYYQPAKSLVIGSKVVQ